jgi:formyltetrahydrofolate hydrolase
MIILIQCNDKVGLVAAISHIIADSRLNIISMREHVEKADDRFFTRIIGEGEIGAGKEIETAVFARALHLVFDDKVMVYKNKTVILE